MKLFIQILVVFFCVFLLQTSVSAADNVSVEQIHSYHVDVLIKNDGSVSISERVLYDFPEARHGMYRYIPYIKTTDEGKRLKLTFENITVTDEKSNAYMFTTSYVDNDLVLKIGNPNQTITGQHVYVISYDVKGALTYFPAHDELYWNTVGTQWKIPSLKATATVTLPQELIGKDIQTKCFVGSQGTTTTFCTATQKESIVTLTAARPLEPYEGMTVVVGFPKGIVAEVNPTEIIPFFDTKEGKLVVVGLLIVAIFWYGLLPFIVVWRWWTNGWDPKPIIGQAVAWYSPPKAKKGRELTPAETGTLIDERVDLKDIYGSLIDLARRGHFRIIETKKNTFDLERTNGGLSEELQPFETKLLLIVFSLKNRVTLRDVKLYDNLSELHSMIYDGLVDDGFFPVNPQTIRNKYIALMVLSFITMNPILFITAWIFGMNMPKKTLFGSEQSAKARALKNFLKSQDKHLAFQAKEKFMFEKLLPYAIAFGVEAIWAKRFKDMSLPKLDWYVSSSSGSHFSSVVFVNSLHTGYAVSFASSVSSTSSSRYHSGFSSGGSSGGGGGGGGGGSW